MEFIVLTSETDYHIYIYIAYVGKKNQNQNLKYGMCKMKIIIIGNVPASKAKETHDVSLYLQNPRR